MKFLVDTNILINALHSEKASVNFIDLNLNNIVISYVTWFEIINGSRSKKEYQELISFLSNFTIVYGNEEVDKLEMSLIQEYFFSIKLELNDAIIASTSIKEKLKLITLDYKHMHKIKGLNVDKI